ncbi:M3 family metallopeptidase [Algoriphagus sp. C2-6-M1]|uniref:M3 family metallopeptidase n=1 Tax=Algoriphagus persicinus TaxID=3108754 RepID=UPI002B3E9D37|nr:M3 family metallopeptidase [Algoriphagus sp. C2-6-M1]MEB2781693.1 M3 family metallopeptidase [Algoriphagus sp. C2-6-M1]
MNNPLLADFATPFDTAPFDQISPTHFLPAVKKAIDEAKEDISRIKAEAHPTFENTIASLDNVGKRLGIVAGIFFNLNAAETNEEIQSLAREISPLLTAHGNDILLDHALFQRVSDIFEQKDQVKLSPEQATLLEKTYKSFVRNGAKLTGDKAVQLRKIDQELAQVSLKFGENVLAETNKFVHFVDQESDLEGLPEGVKEAAAQIAEEKGQPEKWAFTLDYPSYIPAMTYVKNRALRETLFMASGSRCAKGDELDNQEIIKEILKLRHDRAVLLGYKSHADFVLEERMAKSPGQVISFLDSLLEKAKPKGIAEVKELEAFAKELDGIEGLKKWDFAYYSEQLKKEKYALNDELLRPYFQLEKVIDGVFQTAEKLFGITFTPVADIPLYHKDVITYEVKDKDGKYLSVFYADFFPRAGKRNGAWMTSYKGQSIKNGDDIRPHVSIVCNFTKPTKSKPSLLTFNEVTTLFHEFGHALHGMMAKGTYESLSGTNVFWDFVELPSQIFENWCYEKECLDLFAKHYETGEKIPEDLIEKIKKASNFLQGYQTVRQISLSLLDMAYHSKEPTEISSIFDFEEAVMKPTDLLPKVPGTLMSTSFSHIFQGGYSSGYYSYKWAEVLDADAFELFQEKGIFDQATADSFVQNILSAGGREHPSLLYKRFRGRDPQQGALLKRAGLISG